MGKAFQGTPTALAKTLVRRQELSEDQRQKIRDFIDTLAENNDDNREH